MILIAMCKLGYKETDFSFKSFSKFTNELVGDKNGKTLKNLDEFDAFNKLNKIYNFLKHNSIASYNMLKRYYPDNVRSVENKTSNVKYENGIYACD